MEKNVLWSLRLGFSASQSAAIDNWGLKDFLERSGEADFDNSLPDFLQNQPRTMEAFREYRKKRKALDKERKREEQLKEIGVLKNLKAWWLEKMIHSPLPLREKMTLFWMNHFVVAYDKVKVIYWLYQYNALIRQHALGNFRELTRQILKTNAMVFYLDNQQNKKGKPNENLSRELLELFTLGIGNYTEDDVKNGAKGLAGLTLGENRADYNAMFTYQEPAVYLGWHGMLTADVMIDRIFEHPNAPYFLTGKLLKWLLDDEPSPEQIKKYGDYFRKVDFEIMPLLKKIADNADDFPPARKIKDPATFAIQLSNECRIEKPDTALLSEFLRKQHMELFNPPNVKGWEGGRVWLTSQILLQRMRVCDLLCAGRPIDGKKNTESKESEKTKGPLWHKNQSKVVIDELSGRLLSFIDQDMQKNFEQILPYDFDPNASGADAAVLRLFNNIIKTPEFQLI